MANDKLDYVNAPSMSNQFTDQRDLIIEDIPAVMVCGVPEDWKEGIENDIKGNLVDQKELNFTKNWEEKGQNNDEQSNDTE